MCVKPSCFRAKRKLCDFYFVVFLTQWAAALGAKEQRSTEDIGIKESWKIYKTFAKLRRQAVCIMER